MEETILALFSLPGLLPAMFKRDDDEDPGDIISFPAAEHFYLNLGYLKAEE